MGSKYYLIKITPNPKDYKMVWITEEELKELLRDIELACEEFGGEPSNDSYYGKIRKVLDNEN